jgi:hypothetical protein
VQQWRGNKHGRDEKCAMRDEHGSTGFPKLKRFRWQ